MCEGLGWVQPDEEQTPPACYEACIEFFLLDAMIEKHGVQGTLALMRVDGQEPEFDPLFLDAMTVFHGELDRLEFEHEIEQAEKQRNKK